MKILCVCLGNICRSPTAEAVLKHLLGGDHIVDSAGTSAWHGGEPPDGRSTYHASLRGYSLSGASRAVRESDFEDYDLILAMDKRNQFDLVKMCPNSENESKIKLITDFCKIHEADRVKEGVPDPYYDGERGFGFVLDIIEDASHEIVKKIKSKEI
jgi:protein-tyrosine phosphatase